MIQRLAILILISCAGISQIMAQEIIIKTISGNGTMGYGGDNGPAIDGILYYPEAVSLDKWGNLYIADYGNSRIRKITLSTGIITTVAGVDTFGYSGDGGQATNAELKGPVDVFTDTSGNIFFADAWNSRIRKITASTGIITTIAGNGIAGYSGDNRQATNAELNMPSGLCIDKHGNIYIADYYNNIVRKVDGTTNIITTFAGTGANGYTGNGGPATNAKFNAPEKVFVDSTGNLYISDQFNSAVRKVDTNGIISTIAGNGTVGYSGDNGLAINAQLNQPGGLFVDKLNNLFFAEYGNGTIRKVDGVTGIITTIAGTGICGFAGDGGPATAAKLYPDGVLFDDAGTMFIADYQNMRIREVYSTLAVNPLNLKSSLSLYPNPAHDELTIENAGGNEMEIYDMVGRSCGKYLMASDKETINISYLSCGVYMVQVTDVGTGGRVVRRVVKE